MHVEYSGWTKEKGTFSYTFYINEASTDYEIHYENGYIAKQTSEFKTFTYDWNHDGDVYPMFGAFFSSRLGGSDFFTPHELIDVLVGSHTGEDYDYNTRMIFITGIELPPDLAKTNRDNIVNKRRGR